MEIISTIVNGLKMMPFPNVSRNRFMKDLKVSKIAIGTQEMPPREGENRSRMVSTIEIALSKE